MFSETSCLNCENAFPFDVIHEIFPSITSRTSRNVSIKIRLTLRKRFCITFHFQLLKPLAMPMGQMPVLEVDGRRVHQSLAMCRYVAKQVGVAGNDAFEDLQIDAIVDTINEFRLSKFQEKLNL